MHPFLSGTSISDITSLAQQGAARTNPSSHIHGMEAWQWRCGKEGGSHVVGNVKMQKNNQSDRLLKFVILEMWEMKWGIRTLWFVSFP